MDPLHSTSCLARPAGPVAVLAEVLVLLAPSSTCRPTVRRGVQAPGVPASRRLPPLRLQLRRPALAMTTVGLRYAKT
eukprot:9821031-Alexandrium_andersonii.AAC.1